MTCIFFIALLFVHIFFNMPVHGDDSPAASNVTMACGATRFPDVCKSSLSSNAQVQDASKSSDIITGATQAASQGISQIYGLAQTLLQMAAGDANLSEAARECMYFLDRANGRLARSQQTPLSAGIQDVQAWMSAALTYENDCRSALSYVNTTGYVNQMLQQADLVIILTSNALSMVDAYGIYGEDSTNWQPPGRASLIFSPFRCTEASGRDLIGTAPSDLKPSLVVAMDGTGDYASIQAAVDASPAFASERSIIYIKEGIYEEHVRIPDNKTFLAFVGDGASRTVITGNRNVKMPGVTTHASATVAVDGDGFICRDITIENTAGPEHFQAVALRVDSDFAAFHNCSILGNQDTLYVHSLRQLYKDCRIEGTIDFIFGNAAAVFQNCLILVRPGLPQAPTSTVTAQGRTDPAQTTALVFQNCFVNGTDLYMEGFYSDPKMHQAYLGRPWKVYSRTIFIHTYLGPLIMAEGWLPWNGAFALDTLLYGEYQDYGPGANVNSRASWSSQLTQAEALHFMDSEVE